MKVNNTRDGHLGVYKDEHGYYGKSAGFEQKIEPGYLGWNNFKKRSGVDLLPDQLRAESKMSSNI